MHMALAHRLRQDEQLPAALKALFGSAQHSPFLFGKIAPDARLSSGLAREDTHFYRYQPIINPPPAQQMLKQYPSLGQPTTPEQAAFIAGYLGHLAMDQIWCEQVLFPRFIARYEDGTYGHKEMFLRFHILVGHLDSRDRLTLPANHYDLLCAARPDAWLPFITDADLAMWRDNVASQLAPGGESRTLEILGKVAGVSAAVLANHVAQDMAWVWACITPAQLAQAETAMYEAVRQTVIAYWATIYS
jgi:hypothetical protein